MPGAVPLVRVIRSGLEESVHRGHVAVCDARGRLVAAAGDPERLLFSRSSMKPLQAAVALRRIAVDLDDELIAIMCASHNAERAHVSAVRRLLRTTGAAESQLRCPPDRPMRGDPVARPRRILHNCSGKHAGMLGACVGAGWPVETYREPDHPLQRQILGAVRRATGVDEPRIGVDGCGVPVFGLPLRAMATTFARLAEPGTLRALRSTAGRAVAAMRAHPFLVAGTGRTDTTLMERAPTIVAKGGAEALHCAVSLEAGLGVAVKVEDGGDRAAGPALVQTLVALGLADADTVEELVRRPVHGGGRPVGELSASFRLRRIG
jgi:L-asparaginase II